MKLHEEQIIAQQLPLAPPHPLSTFQELELGVIGLSHKYSPKHSVKFIFLWKSIFKYLKYVISAENEITQIKKKTILSPNWGSRSRFYYGLKSGAKRRYTNKEVPKTGYSKYCSKKTINQK